MFSHSAMLHGPRPFFLLLLLGGAGSPLAAQQPLVIPRITDPVVIDGLSDEPGWREIEPLPVVMLLPVAGAEPTERTEIRLAYDDNFLYVSGRLYDSNPAGIQANSRTRDSQDGSSDWFGIVIDSFDDNENALAFFTTPAGLRWDATVVNDAQPISPWSDRPLNANWDTFWDVATARSEKGWFAEFRIPFSSLRFQDRNGRVVMGIIVRRLVARKEEHIIFPAIGPDWGFMGSFKPSQARDCIFEDIYSDRTLYVSPYGLAGVTRNVEEDASTAGYRTLRSDATELGLDLKYGLTSNLTLDVTVNTDFAQVEADDQQVNLTRFSLFLPEKRRFFQERSSNFDFTFIGPNRLFYSRRIGISGDRRTRIYGGARVVGRIGSWDLGALSMQTAAVDDVPGENIGVLRLRRRVLNPFSYFGGIATTRLGTDGDYNVTYGLDARLRLFSNDYLTIKWAQTIENENTVNPFAFEPARLHVNWERPTTRGLGYFVGASHVGAAYDPGVGFERREDNRSASGELGYGWYPKPASPLLTHRALVNGWVVWRNSDGVLESVAFRPGWQFESKSGFYGSISLRYSFEQVPETFSLSDAAEVSEGGYSFLDVDASFDTPDGRTVGLGVDFTGGSFYDGQRVSITLRNRWQASAAFEASADYELNSVAFSERGQRFVAHIGRFRMRYMPSTSVALTAFVQYGSDTDALSTNVRLRYNPREGVDLYLVYDESLNTGRLRRVPVLPLSGMRTLMVKYAHTLVF